MQLKLQRSQRMGGVLSGTVVFCLDVRADYTADERDNINKYKLGGQVIYSSQAARKHFERAEKHLARTRNMRDLKDQAGGFAHGAFSLALAKMSLNISIASLGRGHHIECKDLSELLDAEDTVRDACKDVTRYLQVAETFNGSEVVVEYEDGEERVHITRPLPTLIGGQVDEPGPSVTDAEFVDVGESEPTFDGPPPPTAPPYDPYLELGRYIRHLWYQMLEAMVRWWRRGLAFATSKGWDGIPIRSFEALKRYWSGLEKWCVGFFEQKGLPFGITAFRVTCTVVAAFVVAGLIILSYDLL